MHAVLWLCLIRCLTQLSSSFQEATFSHEWHARWLRVNAASAISNTTCYYCPQSVMKDGIGLQKTTKNGKKTLGSSQTRRFFQKACVKSAAGVVKSVPVTSQCTYIRGQLATARVLSHRRFDTRFDKRRFLTSFNPDARAPAPGHGIISRNWGAPGRLGNSPEPQKSRLRQTKNALTSTAR